MNKYILCFGLLATISLAPHNTAQAQSNDVRALCTNKYGLGKNAPTASEAARRDAAAKIAACIRSGGKS